MSQPMGLRESLARIAAALEGLLDVASGYKVRRNFTSREAAFIEGVPMDLPPERLNGPSEHELYTARKNAEVRRGRIGQF